jgi:hypothetical protein
VRVKLAHSIVGGTYRVSCQVIGELAILFLR